MSPRQLANELLTIFPELGQASLAAPEVGSLAVLLARFAAFTHEVCQQEQVELLARCFQVANRLLHKADRTMMAAFRNAYFPGLHLEALASGDRLARQLMPAELFSSYIWYQYVSTHH